MLSCDPGVWLALQVIPRHEKKIDQLLEYRGYSHFLPTHTTSRTWSDRNKLVDQPLFPGYVFCRNQRSLMEVVHGASGIIRIVSFGGKPHPVPDEEIEALRRMVQSERPLITHFCLNTGQKVRVISGPLIGITGTIVQLKGRDRLVISVNPIMKSVSVAIACSEVELA